MAVGSYQLGNAFCGMIIKSNSKPMKFKRNRDQSGGTSRPWRAVLLRGSFAFLSAISAFGDVTANWTRDVTDGATLKDYPGIPFVIVITSSVNGHLWAECAYQYIEENGSIVVHGTKGADGEFSPFVSYEVGTEGTTKWKTIGKFSESKDRAVIEIGSRNPRVLFHVDMEPFRSSIGKFRWGRVVLENGDAALFAIDDLLPAGSNPDAAGNFKQHLVDPEPKRFGSSFALVSVTSFANRVVGDFIFIGGRERSFAEINGTETRDGDFWPSVTLQAGNANNDWQTIGKSTNEGSQTSLKAFHKGSWRDLRIVLDSYKPHIGQFRYGKIVFSGGEYAVFRIVDLKSIRDSR